LHEHCIGRRELHEAGADVAVTDVYDAEMLRGAMAMGEPEVVMHQLTALPHRLGAPDAAKRFAETSRIRVEGTRALIEAACAVGAPRVVAQSLAFAYAPRGGWVKDESEPLFLDAPSPWGAAVGGRRRARARA
jgi:nucleoside-diphosphate-sugar epimerase